MNPTQIRLITILGTKGNIPNLKITWTLIRHIFPRRHPYVPLMSPADVIYKIANSDTASKPVDINSHLIDSFMIPS